MRYITTLTTCMEEKAKLQQTHDKREAVPLFFLWLYFRFRIAAIVLPIRFRLSPETNSYLSFRYRSI